MLLWLWALPFAISASAASLFQARQVNGICGTKNPPAKRIAIVGTGASGASAAYFMARAARQQEEKAGLRRGSLLKITVYEKEDHIGGRATTIYPKGDRSFDPHEIGGSIISRANKNLVNAMEKFNLTTAQARTFLNIESPGIALWNGEDIVHKWNTGQGWRYTYEQKAFNERYGSPLLLGNIQKASGKIVASIDKLYNASNMAARGPMDSVSQFAETSDLGSEYTSITGSEWARSTGFTNELGINEFLESNTRSNYGRAMQDIHGLGAGVSMAAGGGFSVKGGNARIFQEMLKDSGAKVRLSTPVTKISPIDSVFHVTAQTSKGKLIAEEYDLVFFAAPWHTSPIEKTIKFEEPIPETPYIKTYITLLTTSSVRPKSSYFGVPEDTWMPQMVVTTGEGERNGGPAPEFEILMYLGMAGEEWVVKIHSEQPMTDEALSRLFDVTWVYRHEWDAYPALGVNPTYPPMEPIENFHYLASFEPWVSTLETQTISAREAVARVVDNWWGLGMGDCSNGESWDMTC